MFQRQELANSQLNPQEWKAAIAEVSQAWQRMPKKERDAYEAIAIEEQGRRDEAMLQPFPPKSAPASLGKAAFDAAATLGRSALKTISMHRLINSYAGYKASDSWKHFDAGLACAEAALNLDLIDISATHEEVASTWQNFVKPAEATHGWDASLEKSIHHKVCGTGHGLCVRMPFFKQAEKFSQSLHDLVASGALLQQTGIKLWDYKYKYYNGPMGCGHLFVGSVIT